LLQLVIAKQKIIYHNKLLLTAVVFHLEWELKMVLGQISLSGAHIRQTWITSIALCTGLEPSSTPLIRKVQSQ